jgi:hypothetical protein
MKPAWDQLMMDYGMGEDILVADVDCTAEGEQLCSDHGIEGFPTLKYGDPNALKDYEGGRDYEELAEFAKEHLGPSCGVESMNLCDDEQKAKIEAVMAKGLEQISAEIDEIRKIIESAEEKFSTEEQKLQDEYEKLLKEKDEAIEAAKPKDFIWKEMILQHLNPEYGANDDGEDLEYFDGEEFDGEEFEGEEYNEYGDEEFEYPEDEDEYPEEEYQEYVEEEIEDGKVNAEKDEI